jgi:outer membrane protein OmpA-like peptidoglycan-associated protein
LPKLKKGKKYTLGSINFFGNSPEYLPSSAPAIENLYKLMKKNKNLEILIEGHTNGCFGGGMDVNVLSQLRAEKIGDYLFVKGIEHTRIKTEGKGCKEMLYPSPKSELEQELNRRVEIKVLEF